MIKYRIKPSVDYWISIAEKKASSDHVYVVKSTFCSSSSQSGVNVDTIHFSTDPTTQHVNRNMICMLMGLGFYPTVNDAVKVRMAGGMLDECEANQDVLLSDTMDQYRTFQMCERLLQSPAKLANQLLFQIPPHRQTMLIER